MIACVPCWFGFGAASPGRRTARMSRSPSAVMSHEISDLSCEARSRLRTASECSYLCLRIYPLRHSLIARANDLRGSAHRRTSLEQAEAKYADWFDQYVALEGSATRLRLGSYRYQFRWSPCIHQGTRQQPESQYSRNRVFQWNRQAIGFAQERRIYASFAWRIWPRYHRIC